MINIQRGEATFTLRDQVYIMRITLGALAKLETALGVKSYSEAFQQLSDAPSANLLIAFFDCFVDGLDSSSLTMSELSELQTTMAGLMNPLAEDAEDKPPGKPEPAKRRGANG